MFESQQFMFCDILCINFHFHGEINFIVFNFVPCEQYNKHVTGLHSCLIWKQLYWMRKIQRTEEFFSSNYFQIGQHATTYNNCRDVYIEMYVLQ